MSLEEKNLAAQFAAEQKAMTTHCPSCGGPENYHEPHCQQQRDDLRAINAQLLEALEDLVKVAGRVPNNAPEFNDAAVQAYAAIKEAKSGP